MNSITKSRSIIALSIIVLIAVIAACFIVQPTIISGGGISASDNLIPTATGSGSLVYDIHQYPTLLTDKLVGAQRSSVYFGALGDSSYTDTYDGIEWLVLSNSGGELMLMSYYMISESVASYTGADKAEGLKASFWANSSPRAVLNGGTSVSLKHNSNGVAYRDGLYGNIFSEFEKNYVKLTLNETKKYTNGENNKVYVTNNTSVFNSTATAANGVYRYMNGVRPDGTHDTTLGYSSGKEYTYDYLYILDYEDIVNPAYGFAAATIPDNASLPANATRSAMYAVKCGASVYGTHTNQEYWLRERGVSLYSAPASPYYNFTLRVTAQGQVDPHCGSYPVKGLRPVFNMDASSIMMISAPTIKSNLTSDAFVDATGSDSGKYRLTMYDSALDGLSATAVVDGDKLKLEYANVSADAQGEAVTAIIKRRDGAGVDNIVYYALVSDSAGESGSATITLPGDYNPSTDKIYVMSERLSDNKSADSASYPVEVSSVKFGIPQLSVSDWPEYDGSAHNLEDVLAEKYYGNNSSYFTYSVITVADGVKTDVSSEADITYTSKLTIGGGYTWTDGSTETDVVWGIKRRTLDFDWSAMSSTYDYSDTLAAQILACATPVLLHNDVPNDRLSVDIELVGGTDWAECKKNTIRATVKSDAGRMNNYSQPSNNTFVYEVNRVTRPAPQLTIDFDGEKLIMQDGVSSIGLQYSVGGIWYDMPQDLSIVSLISEDSDVTLTFQLAGVGGYNQSPSSLFTIPKRPKAEQLTVDYEAETVTIPSDYLWEAGKTEPSVIASSPVTIGLAVYLDDASEGDWSIYYYRKHTDSSFRSNVARLAVPKRSAAPVFTIDYVNEKTMEIAGGEHTFEFLDTPGEFNGSGTRVNLEPSDTSSRILKYYKKATATDFKTADGLLNIPRRPTRPSLNWNSSTGVVTDRDGAALQFAYSADGNYLDVDSFTFNSGEVYFRKKAVPATDTTEGKFASLPTYKNFGVVSTVLTAVWSGPFSYVYNGEVRYPKPKFVREDGGEEPLTDEEVRYYFTSGGFDVNDISAIADAGSYNVRVDVVKAGYELASEDDNKDFTVTPRMLEAPSLSKTLIYSGEAYNIVDWIAISGIANPSEIIDAIDDGEITVDADTYYTQLKIKGDKFRNYKWAGQSDTMDVYEFEWSILKQSVMPKWDSVKFLADGQVHYPQVVNVPAGLKVLYEKVESKEVGTYEIRIFIDPTDTNGIKNYKFEGTRVSIKYAILPSLDMTVVSIEWDLPEGGLIYNGSVQYPKATVLDGDGNPIEGIQLAYSGDYLTSKWVGNYKVQVKLPDGYYVLSGAMCEYAIVKDAQGGGLVEVALVTEGEYKRNYNAGDVFDASGITVYVQYSDGSKVPVTDYTFSKSPLEEGATYVRITRGDLYCDIEITVAAKSAGGLADLLSGIPLWQLAVIAVSVLISVILIIVSISNSGKAAEYKRKARNFKSGGSGYSAMLPLAAASFLGLEGNTWTYIAIGCAALLICSIMAAIVTSVKKKRARDEYEQAERVSREDARRLMEEELRHERDEMKIMMLNLAKRDGSYKQSDIVIDPTAEDELVNRMTEKLLPVFQRLLGGLTASAQPTQIGGGTTIPIQQPAGQQAAQPVQYTIVTPVAVQPADVGVKKSGPAPTGASSVYSEYSADDEEYGDDIDDMWEMDAEDDETSKERRLPPNFRMKLKLTCDFCRDAYTSIMNAFMSYKGITYRMSSGVQKIKHSGEVVAVVGVAARHLKVWFALDPLMLDESKYHHRDVSDKEKYIQVPTLMRIRSNRALEYTLGLIKILADKYAFQPRRKYSPQDIQELAFTLKHNPLLKSEYKAMLALSVDVKGADKMLGDEVIDSMIERKRVAIAPSHMAVVTVAELDACFHDGQQVNLETVIKRGIVSDDCDGFTVKHEGELTKPLIVKANGFTPCAAKMIVLTGGRAIALKKM